MKNTCPNDIFTCPQAKVILYLKLYVHNALLACPIVGLSKCLPESDFYLPQAIGQVLYLAPCNDKPTMTKQFRHAFVNIIKLSSVFLSKRCFIRCAEGWGAVPIHIKVQHVSGPEIEEFISKKKKIRIYPHLWENFRRKKKWICVSWSGIYISHVTSSQANSVQCMLKTSVHLDLKWIYLILEMSSSDCESNMTEENTFCMFCNQIILFSFCL